MFIIEEELKKLPKKPGVYLMKDKDDKIIYVGKAINLKNRVSSYFRKTDKTNRILKKNIIYSCAKVDGKFGRLEPNLALFSCYS